MITSFLSKASSLPKYHSDLFPQREKKFEWVKDGTLKNSSETLYSLNKDKRWDLPDKIEEQLDKFNKCRRFEESFSAKAGRRKRKSSQVRRHVDDQEEARTVLVEGLGVLEHSKRDHVYAWKVLDSHGEFKRNKSWRSHKGGCQGDVVYHVRKPVPSSHWPHYADGAAFNKAANFHYHRFIDHGKGRNKARYMNFEDEVHEYYKSFEFDEAFELEEEYEGAVEPCASMNDDYIDVGSLVDEALSKSKSSGCPLMVPVSVGLHDADDDPKGRANCKYGKGEYVIVEKDEPWEFVDIVDDLSQCIPTRCGAETRDSIQRAYISNAGDEKERETSEREIVRAFWKNDLRSEVLRLQYGQLYVEAGTQRRTFAIFSQQRARSNHLFSSALLFSDKDELHSRDSDVAFLSVRCFGDARTSALVIKENAVTDLKSFVDCFISPVPGNHKKTKSQTGMCSSIIGSYSQMRSSTHRLCDVFNQLLNVSQQDLVVAGEPLLDPAHLDYPFDTYAVVCPICLCSKPSVMFTSLRACGHVVCNVCWAAYLSSKLSYGCFPTCPEFKCGAKVDIVTIMSLADPKSSASFLRVLCEKQISSAENIRFCPNVNCANFAVAHSGEKGLLSSSKVIVDSPVVSRCCRLKWCFWCMKTAHWPASCQAAAAYQRCLEEEVGTLYDESGKLYAATLELKKCPSCHILIEKWTGCDRVVCHCGRGFCWSCGHDLSDHTENCKEVRAEFSTQVFSDLADLGGGRVKRLLRTALKYRVDARDLRTFWRRLKAGNVLRSIEYNRPNSRAIVAKQAVGLLVDCYSLLEYIVVAKATCVSRNTSARLSRFEKGLSFRTGMLKDALAVEKLVNVKVDLLSSLSLSIREFLKCLKGFGLLENQF